MHEITEGYAAAKISQKSGQSSGPDGTDGSVYEKAHKAAAIKQPGSIQETYYDNKGNIIPPSIDANGKSVPPLDNPNFGAAVWRAKGQPVHSIMK